MFGETIYDGACGCCLRYVMNQQMTNQSLRERFKLPENKATTVSQIIAATMEVE